MLAADAATPCAEVRGYIDLPQLLRAGSNQFPEYLDALTFDFRGIRIHAYGVLHGLTGGTNQSYRELVNRTIARAPGLRLGEMRFQALYDGLDGELDDWMQIPLRDAFRFSLALHLTPLRIVKLLRAFAREKRSIHDRFAASDLRRLQDIGGSPAFHAISPSERRRFAGFPEPSAYLAENIARREGRGALTAPVFPDRDWSWLTFIEPYANIPLRSIHMLEFSAATARMRGASDVSVFVGEIHNSDMAWYASIAERIRERPVLRAVLAARAHASNPASLSASINRMAFNAANLAGSASPILFYATSCALAWIHLIR
ncbi:hypothetical protein [Burkholderia aenigmatica]|uniref:hypothetical protein n=1 Tax=Burkholderia aenigmatica TaxID=2015348 RepID=UPI0026556024|nr:hypothetical protein [Burkholderia aenigmatica]MDN7880124.1 hypothetical protein [Burkholderia aenigmatica]